MNIALGVILFIHFCQNNLEKRAGRSVSQPGDPPPPPSCDTDLPARFSSHVHGLSLYDTVLTDNRRMRC